MTLTIPLVAEARQQSPPLMGPNLLFQELSPLLLNDGLYVFLYFSISYIFVKINKTFKFRLSDS